MMEARLRVTGILGHAAGASGANCVTSGTQRFNKALLRLPHRHVERARMRLVVEQSHGDRARVLHGLLRDGVRRVVVLLTEYRIDRCDRQTQTAALGHLPRDESKMLEVI